MTGKSRSDSQCPDAAERLILEVVGSGQEFYTNSVNALKLRALGQGRHS
jgi:hypothetical protein